VKQNQIVITAAVAAFAVCGVGWMLVPALQNARCAGDAVAAIHLERARRMFDRHSFALQRKSLLLERISGLGLDVDLDDASQLLESAEDEYQQKHEELWETFQPTDWSAHPPRPARAAYGDLSRQVDEGVDSRNKLIEENRRELEEALGQVELALAVPGVDSLSSTYAEAMRLKGTILLHMGLAEWLRAKNARSAAEPFRSTLTALIAESGEHAATRSLVGDSGIDDQIGLLQTAATKAESELHAHRRALAELGNVIRDFEGRIAAARSRTEAARERIDELRSTGADLSAPAAADSFQAAYMDADDRYRRAEREVRYLTAGFYPHAEIEVTRDFLNGRYLEKGSDTGLTVEYGLQHFQDERALLAATIELEHRGVNELRADIARLEGVRSEHQSTGAHAVERLAAAAQSAAAEYTKLNKLESEASAIEDAALALFGRSADAFSRAADDARKQVNQAQALLAGVSPAAKQRSPFSKRAQSGWVGGYTAAQRADALMASAWIHYVRFAAHRQNAVLFARFAESLKLHEARSTDAQTNADAAREAGIQALTDALDTLEQAHRATGGHWTIVAQEAGALYLLSLFDKPSYVKDAIEAYRNATKGREDAVSTRKLVARLRRLEAAQ